MREKGATTETVCLRMETHASNGQLGKMCRKMYVCAPYFCVNAGLGKLGGKGQTLDRTRRQGIVYRVLCP